MPASVAVSGGGGHVCLEGLVDTPQQTTPGHPPGRLPGRHPLADIPDRYPPGETPYYPNACWDTPPTQWKEGMAHTCENMTFPYLLLRAVKNITFLDIDMNISNPEDLEFELDLDLLSNIQ